jgi:hypothetical protein
MMWLYLMGGRIKEIDAQQRYTCTTPLATPDLIGSAADLICLKSALN